MFRWFQELKPQTKVGLVTVTLILSGVALLVVSLSRFEQVRRSAADLHDRSLPARTQLEKVDQSLELTTWKFSSILVQPDGASQVVMLEDTRRQLTTTDNEWQRFKQVSLDRPGEQELRAEFERLQAHQRDLSGPVGLGLISGLIERKDPGELFADRTFVELRDTQRQMSDIIRRMEYDLYEPVVNEQLDAAGQAAETGIRDIWIAYATVMFVSSVIAIVAFRSARRTERMKELDETKRRVEANRNELETRLYRALEMATTEEAALKLVGQAIVEAIPDQATELLVAESGVAHFRQVLSTDVEHRGPGCPVVSPADCPAATRGNTMVFPSSTALDACPFLRERTDRPIAASCQPVLIAGKPLGVIHTTYGPSLPDEETFVALELIARRAGERVGMLRAFAESESAARSDPLTGLLNRRSLDSAVRRMLAEHHTYAVAYGDLDHFKRLNDTFGHDVGDRALRLFAKALRDAVRPNDLVCRYGGEEFVVVLPECPLEEAVPVLERVREAVADIGTSGRVPAFTVSFGVASSAQADSFERVVSLADAALLQAKADGRDRVTVSAGQPQAALPAGPPAALPVAPAE